MVCREWLSFEARKPKNSQSLAKLKVLSLEKIRKASEKFVTPEIGEAREYLIPQNISAFVREMCACWRTLDGWIVNPHDILGVLGEKELAKSLVDSIQEIYRLQGAYS